MTLGRLLLEQGLEVELKAGMKDIIAFLDEEVPSFFHDGYGFRMSPLRGVVGSEWKIMINPWDLTNNADLGPPVGLLEVDEMDGGGISFRMPPGSCGPTAKQPALTKKVTFSPVSSSNC